MIVVSEMGEQWSPQTAPAIQAEIARIVRLLSKPWNAERTMGIRMPNVPQEVPVEKERPTAIRKMIAGRNIIRDSAEPLTISAIKRDAPRLSVMPLSVQANVRIRIAGTIALKPAGMLSIRVVNLIRPNLANVK